MKYYIIAGEASGDLHGSNLMKVIQKKDAQADFKIWGGDLMQAVGGVLVKHYRDLAFMGFIEVVKNLRTILDNIKFCKKDILNFQPDVLILIDYPGFNLRIAKWAKQQGFRVVYYISPQIWAWRSSRVHGIKKSVSQMLVILPFEKDFYAQYGMPVDFVGHPLLDAIRHLPASPDFRTAHHLNEKPIIALLPGSRKQEISRMLEEMLQVVPTFPDHQFVIAAAPAVPLVFYTSILEKSSIQLSSVRIVQDVTYTLLQHAVAALVTSGTATLETALFQVPQVVCYKGSPVSYFIARRLVNVAYISLVNLIMNRPVVEELIQSDCEKVKLEAALKRILSGEKRTSMIQNYQLLIKKLGQGGASEKAASLIINCSKINN